MPVLFVHRSCQFQWVKWKVWTQATCAVTTKISHQTVPVTVGSGSVSSPMREHQNFAQFYCISVTNFSTVSECILLEIIWIKRSFSSHSYGCFYVCMQCTLKNWQLIFYGRYLPFVRCRSRGPRHERKQLLCLSARWKSDMRCTQHDCSQTPL